MNLTKKYQARRGNKYGAKAVVVNGERFDSQGEREMHQLLLLMERGKLISNIRRQQTIPLVGKFKVKIDWVVFDHELQCDVAIEFKGYDTERWICVKQAWEGCAPLPLRVYKKQGNRIFMYEELKAFEK